MNFLECPWILLLLGIFVALFIPAGNVPGSITTSEEKQRSLLVGYHRWRTDRMLKFLFGWNNVLENVRNPPQKIRYWMFLNFISCFSYEPMCSSYRPVRAREDVWRHRAVRVAAGATRHAGGPPLCPWAAALVRHPPVFSGRARGADPLGAGQHRRL